MTAVAGEPAVVPAYFDAALVARFYLHEPGRDAVRRLARASGVVVSSGIAVAEVSAVFHRKLAAAISPPLGLTGTPAASKAAMKPRTPPSPPDVPTTTLSFTTSGACVIPPGS